MDPRRSVARWRDVLEWKDPRFLADNLIFLRPAPQSGPGIGEVGTVNEFSWNPAGLGTPGRLGFAKNGVVMPPKLAERRVTPFAMWERYCVGDAVWSQRVCLVDDVFVLEGSLDPPGTADILVEGYLRGAGAYAAQGGILSGDFVRGEGQGLSFSFWCSLGAPSVHRVGRDLAYQMQSTHSGACSVLFGVAPTRLDAQTRLCEFRGAWERAAAEAEADWADFFSRVMPPLLLPARSWSDLVCWIGYCLKANGFRLPGDARPRTTGVWKGSCTAIPLENRSLHAIGERWLTDPSLALGDIHPPKRPGRDGGRLLWLIAARAVDRVWGLAGRSPDVYAKARRVVDSFLRRHDRDGDFLPELRSNLTGLGWDNSARFDPVTAGRFEQGMRFDRDFVPLDTSVLLVLASDAAADFARSAGDSMAERYLRGLVEQVRAEIEARSWDEGRGCYFDLMGRDGEPTGVLTPASLFPLWVGLGEGRIDRLLQVALTPSRLWPAFPLPTCSLEDTGYGSYWRGKAALRINWATLEALRVAGRSERGRTLLANMIARYADHGYDCAEMYDATDGGSGQWPYSPEVSLLLDLLVRDVVGLQPLGGGEWLFAPSFLDESWPYARFGPAVYGSDTLEVRWDRPDDGEDWFDDGTEGHWVSLNGRCGPAIPGSAIRR